MAIVLTGLFVALCLTGAGVVTLLKAAFMQLSLVDVAEATDGLAPGNKRANMLEALLAKQDVVLSAFDFGYALLVLLAVAVLMNMVFRALTPLQLGIDIFLLVFFIILLTHILPRAWVFRQGNDSFSALIHWMRGVSFVFVPFGFLLNQFTRVMTLSFPGVFAPVTNLFNTSEYYNLVQRYYEGSAIQDHAGRKQYLLQKNISKRAGEMIQGLMLPADRLELLDAALPPEELMAKAFASNASRLLLYQDAPENIVGILHTRLLMKSYCLGEGDKEAVDVTSAISEPWFVAPETTVIEQLQAFFQRREQFALVRDEKGVLLGAISLEEIFEKISVS